MKEHEECLQEGQLFPQGIILDYMQRNSIIFACMSMTEKLAKYVERLQGRNAFVTSFRDLERESPRLENHLGEREAKQDMFKKIM